jgi:VanZ family protein
MIVWLRASRTGFERVEKLRAVKRFLWHWLPPLVWMGLIFFLSAQNDLPHAPEPWFDMLLKKGGHALAFGILAGLYLRALRGHFPVMATVRLVSAGLAILYGVSDEYHQTLVPGRKGRLFDVGVDAAGVCGAMLLHRWLERRRWFRLTESRPVESRPPAR